MKDRPFALISIGIVALMLTGFLFALVEVHKINMDAYNERMIAFYDRVFGVLLKYNKTNMTFNYTPVEPPHDLSHTGGIL